MMMTMMTMSSGISNDYFDDYNDDDNDDDVFRHISWWLQWLQWWRRLQAYLPPFPPQNLTLHLLDSMPNNRSSYYDDDNDGDDNDDDYDDDDDDDDLGDGDGNGDSWSSMNATISWLSSPLPSLSSMSTMLHHHCHHQRATIKLTWTPPRGEFHKYSVRIIHLGPSHDFLRWSLYSLYIRYNNHSHHDRHNPQIHHKYRVRIINLCPSHNL